MAKSVIYGTVKHRQGDAEDVLLRQKYDFPLNYGLLKIQV
jgi:hypothetical protein